jgi:hypothetical protein
MHASLRAVRRAFAILSLIPVCAGAQSIHGRVLTAAGDEGTPGVLVTLLDSTGSVVARDLSEASGEYRLRAPRSGTFRVRTQRIGFRPVTSGPFMIASGVDIERAVVLAAVPMMLDSVRVVSDNVCGSMGDATGATFALWEQARTALQAAQLTAGRRGLTATVMTFARTLEPRSRRVQTESTTVTTGFVTQPWRTFSATQLRQRGFVVEDDQGWTEYRVPGLNVLLSDGFVEDHCFRVSRRRDRSTVGIEFEPTRARRNLPEIAGIIWLDRATSVLRRMEFRYVNITREQEGEAGGDIEFGRLADGGWAISRWNIRMPVLEQQTIGGRTMVRVGEIRTVGGDLTLAIAGKDTLWLAVPGRPTLATIAGRVVSDSGRPMVDVAVSLPDLGRSTLTDAGGGFQLANIPSGMHRITVRRLGFLPADTTLAISVADTIKPSFVITRAPVVSRAPTLDTVQVRAVALIPSFEENRQLGRGHFLTRDTLAKMTNRPLSSILSEMPSARIVPIQGSGGGFLATRRRSMATFRSIQEGSALRVIEQGFCPAQVYVNGAPAYSGRPGDLPFDINSFSPDAIEAIEYYASAAEVPPRYAGSNVECGVLVIHTRRAHR